MTATHDHEWERGLPALMVRYQAADEAAMAELVRSLSPRLLRFFAASGVGRLDAEDLLQDCWLRIHRSRHAYRAEEPVIPWVFAIARHTRLDGDRRRRRQDRCEVLVADPPEMIVESPAETPSGPEQLVRLLATLPDSQREVVLMLKLQGMSLEDVAKATSSTVGAVKQRAHRAYATLRKAFEKEHIE